MRLSCAVALLVSLCAIALPASRSQQQKPADSKQGRAAQSKSDSLVSVSESHYHAADQKDSSAEQSEHWPPPWYSPFWSNWAFVFVGLGAAIAAVWTLIAIKDQGEHIKNSERAWLMVDLEWVPGFSSPQNTTNDSLEPFTSVPFRLRCSNDGGTPCWIVEKMGCARIVDSVPAEPDLTQMGRMQFSPEPVKVGKEAAPTEWAMGCPGHLNSEKTLIIYEVVRYSDRVRRRSGNLLGLLLEARQRAEFAPNH
jgi:hypothetical protein